VGGETGSTGAHAAPRAVSVSGGVIDDVTTRGLHMVAIRVSESQSTMTYASLTVNVSMFLFHNDGIHL